MPWPGELVASASYVVPIPFRQLSQFLANWRADHLKDPFPVIPERRPPADLPPFPVSKSGPYRLRVLPLADHLPNFGRSPNSVVMGVITHPDFPDGSPEHPPIFAVIMVVESVPPTGDAVADTELWIECYQEAALALYDDLTSRLLARWPAPATRTLHTWRHPDRSPEPEILDSATFIISGASIRDLAGSRLHNVTGWFERQTATPKSVSLFVPRCAAEPVRMTLSPHPYNETVRYVGPDSERLTPPPGVTRFRLTADFWSIPISGDRAITTSATMLDAIVFDMENLADNRTKVSARCYYPAAIPNFRNLLRAIQRDYPEIRWLDGAEPGVRARAQDAATEESAAYRINAPLENVKNWLRKYLSHHEEPRLLQATLEARFYLGTYARWQESEYPPDPDGTHVMGLPVLVWPPEGTGGGAIETVAGLTFTLFPLGDATKLTVSHHHPALAGYYGELLAAVEREWEPRRIHSGTDEVPQPRLHDQDEVKDQDNKRSASLGSPASRSEWQASEYAGAGRRAGTTELFVNREHFLYAVGEAAVAIRAQNRQPTRERVADYLTNHPNLLGEQRRTESGDFAVTNLDRARRRYGFTDWQAVLLACEPVT